jgi:hypothetical protein
MSGGSLDYACYKVEEIAGQVASRAETPLHRAFAEHLQLVAGALHDLEWVWSCDYGPGREVEAISAVVSRADVLAAATQRAIKARDELSALLKD